MEYLLELDRDVLLAVNGLHRPWLDEAMYWISNKYVWIPVYAIILWKLVQTLGWKKALLAGACAGLVILLADQTASGLLKPAVERLRPCHDPLIAYRVHLVHGKCGGSFGFASSHAANFFGLATILTLFFRGRWKYRALTFFLAAGLVAFSRIYLGVHYPGDVLAGALIGMAAGGLVGFFYQFIFRRLSPHSGS